MVARCCLNVAMGGIGILAIGCWLRFNLNVLLRQFYFLLVPPFGWLTFSLMKRFLGPMMAISLQEWKGIILNSFKLICKVSWLA